MNNLKLIRNAKGLTQSHVAEILNVTNATISRYETGNIQPDTETLKQLSELYNVSIDYLLGNDGEKSEETISCKELTDFLSQPYITLNGRILSNEDKERILKLIEIAGI